MYISTSNLLKSNYLYQFGSGVGVGVGVGVGEGIGYLGDNALIVKMIVMITMMIL